MSSDEDCEDLEERRSWTHETPQLGISGTPSSILHGIRLSVTLHGQLR